MNPIQRDSNAPYSQTTTYEEINLPFDHINRDNIKGGELYQGISSNVFESALEDYSIDPEFSENEYKLSARTEFPSARGDQYSYSEIEIRIDPEAEYSHLRLKASAKTEEVLEETLDDLERIEQDLEDHFREDSLAVGHRTALKYKATD